MKSLFVVTFAVLFVFSVNHFAQIPTNILVQIVKSEDERRFDATLENLLKHPNPKIRERAVLAIGRIGAENSISLLNNLLAVEKDENVQTMIMFALGEIESPRGAETILLFLQGSNNSSELIGRAIEAAGKIAAANPKDESSKKLGAAILERLSVENRKRSAPFINVVLPGLTAVLRARPEGGEKVVAEFLGYSTPRVRSDALNTLARLRSKIANEKTRELLAKDKDAIVRANAARLLGVAEDKEALDLLLNAATKDEDSRVRVSAIRALGSLKDASLAEKLIPSTEKLNLANKNELLEIATTLSRLLPNTNNQKAIEFLYKFDELDKYHSPEIAVAIAKIAPNKIDEYLINRNSKFKENWLAVISAAQAIAEVANYDKNEVNDNLKQKAVAEIEKTLDRFDKLPKQKSDLEKAIPNLLTTYSKFKTNNLDNILRPHLQHNDVQIRATAAGLLADQPTSKENFEALNKAFDDAFLKDTDSNDAMLSIMDALFKVNQKDSLPIIFLAFSSDDYLVRKKAFELFKRDDSEYAKAMFERAFSQSKNRVLPFKKGSKQGVILNSNADYVRAVSRKNGTVKAVFTTSKGKFKIDLTPEDAPLTVDNFVKLAKSNYFNGVSVHRVVPNFVMQDGDPRGDGNGGPGWSIRCEVNMLEYGRGAVGMALSGKDTGGSQWFVTHSPQPHLDGGYAVFGQVNEIDMKTVDSIVRGDKIISVKIIGDAPPKSIKINK